MKISVIIPVFNEEKYVKKIIDKVSSINIEKEIIVVDDGSSDNSLSIIENINIQNLKIIKNEKNYGKGYSIKEALKHVKNNIIIIQDADLEYDPNDYFKLLEPFRRKDVFVVYGSRFLGIKRIILNKGLNYNFRAIVNLFLTFLFNIINNQRITDVHTCYKVFDSKIIPQLDLKENGFSFCPEFSTKVSKLGYKIYEVPVSYKPRSKTEGKKISFLDGFHAIRTLIRFKFF